jgi:hypothetical protein
MTGKRRKQLKKLSPSTFPNEKPPTKQKEKRESVFLIHITPPPCLKNLYQRKTP